MGRTPNIKIDGSKLDEAIKKVEGDKFNQGKVSQFIMGRDKTYYSGTVKKNEISPEVLDRVCSYYEFDKEDFIVTAETEKKEIQQKADTQNYENVLTYLKGIDGLLREVLATQKSTNFILNEMKNNLIKSNTNEKALLDKIDAVSKSAMVRSNTYSKFKGA